MYLRLLSETGLIGFVIFCGLLIQVFLWCYNNFNKHNLYSIVILISTIGFSMNWLKMDSLRIYAFWLCLSLIFILESKKLDLIFKLLIGIDLVAMLIIFIHVRIWPDFPVPHIGNRLNNTFMFFLILLILCGS